MKGLLKARIKEMVQKSFRTERAKAWKSSDSNGNPLLELRVFHIYTN